MGREGIHVYGGVGGVWRWGGEKEWWGSVTVTFFDYWIPSLVCITTEVELGEVKWSRGYGRCSDGLELGAIHIGSLHDSGAWLCASA